MEALQMFGFKMTSLPFLTKRVMPPSASIAARVIAAGLAPRAITKYGSDAVGGTGVAVIVGATVAVDGTAVAIARVALGSGDGGIAVGGIAVGGIGVGVGALHAASAVPPAASNIARRNSRRDSIGHLKLEIGD